MDLRGAIRGAWLACDRLGRLLVEVALSAYLLSVPLSRAMPDWMREILLLAIMGGMVLARLAPATGPAPFGLLWPVGFFAGSALVSTVFSTYPAQSLARGAYLPVGLLLFLATQDALTDPAAYRRMRLVLAVVVAAIGVDGTYQFATGRSLLGGVPLSPGVGYRVSASLPNPNDLALIPILLPVALTLAAPLAGRAALIVLGGMPFALAATLVSGSRNAWLTLAVGLGVLAAGSRDRRIPVAMAAATATLALVALSLGIGHVAQRARQFLYLADDPRLGHWLVAWEMFREAPLIGTGLHTFTEFELTRVGPWDYPGPGDPHLSSPLNFYLEVLAERGLLGATTLAILLGAMTLRLRRALANETSPDARSVTLGLAASLSAFLVAGAFELTFLKDWVLLVLLLLAALVARLPQATGSG